MTLFDATVQVEELKELSKNEGKAAVNFENRQPSQGFLNIININ